MINMYNINSTEKKSLQFPAMSDGYVQIPWGDGSNTPAQNVGLWGHTGGITLEFLITPYDIFNNSVTPYSGSQKSLSQSTKGLAYLQASSRKNTFMNVLYNTNLKVTLESLTGSATPNTPASYSISFTVVIGTTSTTITTENIITPEVIDNTSSAPTDYLYSSHTPFALKSARTVSSVSSNTINLSGSSASFVVGEKIYTNAGALIGTISSLGSNSVTVSSITNTPSNSTHIYTELLKEPTYVDVPHHIAVSYSPAGTMIIYYDGQEAKRGIHSLGGDFSFHPSDIYLAQNPTGNYAANRRTQFIGEYHEIAITAGARKSFRSTNSLLPNFKNTLLYMDFEEANLNG